MKNKTKFTPGPWKTYDTDACCIKARGRHIATAHDSDGGRSQSGIGSKNAALIAAAPDMFEALADCIHEFRDSGRADDDQFIKELVVKAEQVLAKARGES